jgi:hypothetical protein
MNVFGYLEEVFLFFKELLCNTYLLCILELYSTLTLVYMVCTSNFLCYLKKPVVHTMYTNVSMKHNSKIDKRDELHNKSLKNMRISSK